MLHASPVFLYPYLDRSGNITERQKKPKTIVGCLLASAPADNSHSGAMTHNYLIGTIIISMAVRNLAARHRRPARLLSQRSQHRPLHSDIVAMDSRFTLGFVLCMMPHLFPPRCPPENSPRKSCPRLHAHHLMSCYDRLCRAAIASTDCDVASRPPPDLTSPPRPAVRQHFTLQRRHATPSTFRPLSCMTGTRICSYSFLRRIYLARARSSTFTLEIHWTVLEGLPWQLLKRRLFIVTTLQSRGVSLPLPSLPP